MISGEPVDSMGKPAELIVANRLVRLCCKGCIRAFRKNPAQHLAMIDKAWTRRGGLAGAHAHGDHEQ